MGRLLGRLLGWGLRGEQRCPSDKKDGGHAFAIGQAGKARE